MSIFTQLATKPFADIKNTPAGSPLQEFQRGQLGGGEEEAAMGIGAHWWSPGASPSTERCSSQLGLLCRGMPRAAGSTQAPGGASGGAGSAVAEQQRQRAGLLAPGRLGGTQLGETEGPCPLCGVSQQQWLPLEKTSRTSARSKTPLQPAPASSWCPHRGRPRHTPPGRAAR